MKKYEKPVVVVDNEVSEGVYAASGAAVVTVKLDSKKEFHAGSGVAKFVISWPADVVLRSITLIFNQNIDSAYANTVAAVSGNKVTFAYNGWNPTSPVDATVKVGTGLDTLRLDSYTFDLQ